MFSPNPFNWKHEHRLALILATVLGGVGGLLIGEVFTFGRYYAGAFSPVGIYLGDVRSMWWAIFGGCVGALIIYIHRLSADKG